MIQNIMKKVKSKRKSPYGRTEFKSIDQYHASFPPSTQKKLDDIRRAIRQALPGSEEIISYNIPAFRQGRNIVNYAGYEHHVGYYPGASPLAEFREELKKYKTSKGGVQFPLDKAIPLLLVKKIAKFRLKEILG